MHGSNFLIIMLIFACFSLLNIFFSLMLYGKIRNVLAKERSLLEEAENKGLEHLLKEVLGKMKDADKQLEEVKFFEQKLLEKLPPCIQKVGLVRFNAFTDIGGDQSFALALLDGKNKGVVISSLYGRNEARVYAKQVEGGQSAYPLSEEEQKALSMAKSQPG